MKKTLRCPYKFFALLLTLFFLLSVFFYIQYLLSSFVYKQKGRYVPYRNIIIIFEWLKRHRR